MRKLIWVGVLLVIGGVLAVSRAKRDAKVEDHAQEVRVHAIELIQSQPWFEKRAKRIGPLIEMADRSAYTIAYSDGGRRRSASFDERKYVDAFFDPLVSAATNSGDKDFSFAVRDLHLRVQQAMDKGEDWWLVADTGAKP